MYTYICIIIIIIIITTTIIIIQKSGSAWQITGGGGEEGQTEGTNVEPDAQRIQQIRDEWRFFLKRIPFRDLEDRLRNQTLNCRLYNYMTPTYWNILNVDL